MVLSAPWRRWELGCLVAADEFCTKTPEDYSSVSLLQKAMGDGIFFFLLLPEVSEVGWVFFSATPHW